VWAVRSSRNVLEPVRGAELLADPKSGVAYQVQVQVPQSDVTSIQDVEHIPVTLGAASIL